MSTPTLLRTTGDIQQEQNFQPSDFSFLPQLLHILQKVESGEDAQEIATLASNLKTSFKRCQMILDHLPGADLSPDEQNRVLEEEMKVLEKKKSQLSTYLSWQIFNHPVEEENTLTSIIGQHIPTTLTTDIIIKSEETKPSSTTESGSTEENTVNNMEDNSSYLEMPSLATDGSSFMMSSQESTAVPGELSSGLSMELSSVKMDDIPEGSPKKHLRHNGKFTEPTDLYISVKWNQPVSVIFADRKRQREDNIPSSAATPNWNEPPSSPNLRSSPPLPESDPEDNGVYDNELVSDLVDEDLEGEGEDLYGSDMENDYAENVRLDQYDPNDIDDEDLECMDPAERAKVEAALDRRDLERARLAGRIPEAFLDDDVDGINMVHRRRRVHEQDMLDDDIEDTSNMILGPEQLSDNKGLPITEWVTKELTRRTIMTEFRRFLLEYVDANGESVYGPLIRALGESNKESLEVSYRHLSEAKSTLAYFVVNAPQEVLKMFDAIAFEVVLMEYPDYGRIHAEIHVRITDLPIISTLRDLRQADLNCLVQVTGVVTRRTGVFPQLKYVKYDCVKCGATLGPFYQDSQTEISINSCTSCPSKGPFLVNAEQTIYRNYQKMTLQESPGTVPAGRLPRHREVILLWDLIDSAKPGEEVEITGVYRNNFDVSLNSANGFPVFATILEANYVNKKRDVFASFRLTEEDHKEILRLAKDENIGKRIIKSIAPSIYGHEDIKTAIALSLFGGVPKDPQGKHRLRGDINVLMMGDPGTAKSQFLKYVEKTAHRAVFTTGQGASAVGLTASVRKDPITREWTLEGGALVLADKGVCLIDEFDKMNDADRTSIHEAMEQQSISISKAGIVTTLQARCSILAAANPIRGRYNPAVTFSENVELTEPILSRFDVLCVVKDTVDPTVDERLANFVLNSHLRSHPQYSAELDQMNMTEPEDTDIIPQDMLRKYIMYARDRIQPKIHQMDQDKIARLYADLRRESLAGGSIPITVRHLESMIRMSEANAKMHLREYARSDDIDMAIRVMLESFFSAQKFSVMRNLKRAFNKYLTFAKDSDELLFSILNDILREHLRFNQVRNPKTAIQKVEIELIELKDRASALEIHDIQPFLSSALFTSSGYTFNPTTGKIEKKF
ncbi:MCM DNA helicase complex subunit [Gryganskiella cystojenkinii]|nr:MCM DNA helicase complex subunit [Gryganskiella cystojenkinii]